MTSKTIYLILPYVYRLDHPTTNEFYIGYRAANIVPSEQDLGFEYFTSAPKIKERFNEFQITILAEFFDPDDAYDHEQYLIYCDLGNPLMLNKKCYYDSKARFNTTGNVVSLDVKIKISDSKVGIPLGKYFNDGGSNIRLKENESIPLGFVKGKILSDKQKISNEKFNAAGHTEESRIKAANTMKKENRSKDFIHGNVGKNKSIWISDLEKKVSTMIKIDEKIPDGWIRGRKFNNIKRTKQPKKKHIHNPVTNKRTKILVDEKIPDGWLAGTGIKPSDESNQARRKSSANKMWITNEETLEEIMIKKDLDIPIGWIKGSHKSNNRRDPLTGKFK